MYPRRPRRVASEHGRVATCCDRLNNRPIPNMGSASASDRSTRSARRHGGTESGFETGLRAVSSTRCPLGKGIFYHRTHGNALRATQKRPGNDVLRTIRPRSRHRFLRFLDSVDGPVREVPASPSARGVRQASDRLTRSAQRYGARRVVFEVGLHVASPTQCPLEREVFTTEHTETPFGRRRRGRENVLWVIRPRSRHRFLRLLDSVDGPGARSTRAALGAWRPTGLRPVNTEHVETRGHGEWF